MFCSRVQSNSNRDCTDFVCAGRVIGHVLGDFASNGNATGEQRVRRERHYAGISSGADHQRASPLAEFFVLQWNESCIFGLDGLDLIDQSDGTVIKNYQFRQKRKG